MNFPKHFRHFDQVMLWFVLILVLSNIASAAKIIDLGFSLFGLRLAFDGGTLLFPLSYIIGDILTEVYGFRASRRVIWSGSGALLFTALVFAALGSLPGEGLWEQEVGGHSFKGVLGGISSGGIVLASLAAYLCGEFSNSFILAILKIKTGGRWLWLRTIGSTLVGEALDSLIFVAIATWLAVFPKEIFWNLVITNYLFKCAIEVACTPATYAVVGFLKKAENIDVYDVQLLGKGPGRRGPR